jgi:hypothetical protein
MQKIYFYKLTTDNGGAPCVQNDLLSLAICKPMMRKSATEGGGDLIFGFAANSLHRDNPLIYLARVTKKLCNGEYFKDAQYAERCDCIYRFEGDCFVWKPEALHHCPEDLRHDLGEFPEYFRANVLLSNDFRYFGEAAIEYKSEFPLITDAIKHLGPGHRVNHSHALQEELICMQEWIWQKFRKMKIGEPMNVDTQHMSVRQIVRGGVNKFRKG